MKNKKIWIDTSFVLNNPTGMGQYVYTLLSCINGEHLKRIEFNYKYSYKSYAYMFWLNTWLYLKSFFLKPNVIIFPAFFMPFFTLKNIKYCTVIHDLCSFRIGEMTPFSEYIYTLCTKIVIKKANIIITVSQTIKNEIIERFSYPANKIKVVYNAVGKHFIMAEDNNSILEKYNLQEKKYILSVATLNKRKNIPTLIKAFERVSDKYPGIKLVLVGGIGNENKEKLSINKNVIFTGYIKDEELPILYKNAMFYAYPSLYEGFGIPLIEAQYCRCPVLCSDIPVFREIAGNSAEFCEISIDGFAEKLEYLIGNEARRNELSLLGKENVKRFSIENIAKQIKECIDE